MDAHVMEFYSGRNQWKRFILMFLVSAFLGAVMYYVADHPDWREIASAFLYTFSLWEGNYQFSKFIIGKYPTFAESRKRLIITFIFIFIFTLVITVLWDGLLYGFHQEVKYFFEMYLFALMVTVLISALYGSIAYFYLLQKSIEEKEEVKRAQMEMELRVLTTQVNPHFLFNSLNTLISIIPDDPQQAVSFTQKLSNVYRYILQSKNKDLVPLKEEMEFVEDYIYLHKIRYGRNLLIKEDLSPEVLEMKTPVLSIQILVENAIKHNAISSSNPLKVWIVATGGYIEVRNIKNPKLQKEESPGTGLANIKNRLAILTGQEVLINDDKEFFSVKIPLLVVDNYESIDR